MSQEKDLAVQMLHLKLELAFEQGLNIPERIIQLIGDIDESMFRRLDTAMTILEADSRKRIKIILNSGGGHVYDGNAIATRIRKSTCKVHIEAHGHVMSAATVILAAGHHRTASKYTNIMIHESFTQIEGRTRDIRSEARQMQFEEEQYCAMLADYTNTPADQWSVLLKTGLDTYLTPNLALELGLINEIF